MIIVIIIISWIYQAILTIDMFPEQKGLIHLVTISMLTNVLVFFSPLQIEF